MLEGGDGWGWREGTGEAGGRPQECPILEGSRLFRHPREKPWPVLPARLAQRQIWVWRELRNRSPQPCLAWASCVILAPCPFMAPVLLPRSEGVRACHIWPLTVKVWGGWKSSTSCPEGHWLTCRAPSPVTSLSLSDLATCPWGQDVSLTPWIGKQRPKEIKWLSQGYRTVSVWSHVWKVDLFAPSTMSVWPLAMEGNAEQGGRELPIEENELREVPW